MSDLKTDEQLKEETSNDPITSVVDQEELVNTPKETVEEIVNDKQEEVEEEQQDVFPMPVLKYSMQAEEDKLLVPLFPIGKIFHPKYGEVEYTEKDYEDIKLNIKRNALGFAPYITHGHIKTKGGTEDAYLEQARLEAVSQDAELKRGEYTDIILKDNTVYGIANNINPNTKKFVQNKEYEYASGEFIKNFIDKSTGQNIGTVLVRSALTNSPYMPFGDKKLQLFSSNGEESLQTVTNFMIKLQEDNELKPFMSNMNDPIQGQESNINPVTEEPKATEPVVTEEPKAVETTVEPTEPTVLKVEELTEPEIEPQSTSAPLPESTLMDLTKQMGDQFANQLKSLEEAYKLKLEAIEASSKQLVNSLTEKVDTLQSQLTQQESIAQQFSTTLSQSAKRARYQNMASKGVSPAVIEQFSLIESAVEGASIDNKVLKFSTSEGKEEERSLLEAIQDLVVNASKSNVSVERFGQNSFQTDDLASQLREKAKQIKEQYSK